MKTYFILLITLCTTLNIFSQNLSYEAKKITQKSYECFENNDDYCGLIYLEKLLKNHSSEMNSSMIIGAKKVLIDTYFTVSMTRIKNNDANFKEYCLKGILLGKEINKPYDFNAFMFHYFMIARYYHLENETLMNKWIEKFTYIKYNFNEDEESKRTMISWADSNIKKMKFFFKDSYIKTTYSVSLFDLFSGSSSTKVPKIKNTYKKSSTKKIVTKTEKWGADKSLGTKVILYYVHTNKNEKINIYYYPHLDKWKFRNDWGEKNRGNKFYESLNKIIKRIEEE
jgi:hypothetical protein